jgi:hypothetical protein
MYTTLHCLALPCLALSLQYILHLHDDDDRGKMMAAEAEIGKWEFLGVKSPD